MNRVEENKDVVKHFMESAQEHPKGTKEEMFFWHLGAINSFIVDISKSLAGIADKMAQEVEE